MRQLLAYFGLAYLISWTIWSPLYIPGLEGLQVLPGPVMHALGAYGPAIAALVLTFASEGKAGLSRWVKSLLDVRRAPRIAVLALSGPFILLGLVVAAVTLFAPGTPLGTLLHTADYPDLSPLALFAFYLCTFAIGEETGWRFFALPRLEEKFSPLVATLFLSAGWALWHWPIFLYWPGFQALGVGGAFGWLVSLVLGAIITTWLFDKSRHSLLVVVLFHAAMNTAFATEPAGGAVTGGIGMLVTLIGIAAAVALWARGRRVPSD
jgi:uncharacterized protein